MSEQCSLYINIQIKEEKLQQFFQEKPLPQSIDENWLQWWDNREMSGKKPLSNTPHFHVQHNRAVFDQLLNGRDFGSVEHYDKDEESWTFITIFFSENYLEILPMLALLKQLALLQDTANTGVSFIYDYNWGQYEVMAYLAFANQQALLKNYVTPQEIEPALLKEANEILEAAVKKFNQQFED
ncbi:hypothetical protein H8B06_06190 [Sphingobacterium sp. DN00404]|uniref:Uncharacterized protein n=1 Tax=Sphingobacterium micropteri TaxID=2763501 RepID=A0ABR7YM73_9SPHI|nr:hypothetical protein [Sphingobacterium micropteri]MBD1432407.1 hypothetical protein [Sphingobacterium micropteri]